MPGVISPDVYLRGDNGQIRQTDGTNDAPVNGWIGGLLYANVAASTAISNTLTETAFDKFATVPANTLIAGSVLKIRYSVTLPNTNGTDTTAVKLYLATALTAGSIAGTALISHAATDCADAMVVSGEYELIIRTAGTGGTMVGVGTYKSVPAAEGTMTIKDDILASTTVNTQAEQYVAVSITNNAASTSTNAILQMLRVEIY